MNRGSIVYKKRNEWNESRTGARGEGLRGEEAKGRGQGAGIVAGTLRFVGQVDAGVFVYVQNEGSNAGAPAVDKRGNREQRIDAESFRKAMENGGNHNVKVLQERQYRCVGGVGSGYIIAHLF